MKFKKKDLIILLGPVVVMILVTPFLPNKIPIHFDINGHANGYLNRNFSFLLGVIPFAAYKSYKIKHGLN